MTSSLPFCFSAVEMRGTKIVDIVDVRDFLLRLYRSNKTIPSIDWLNRRPLNLDKHIVNICLLDAEDATKLAVSYGNPGLQHQAYSKPARQMKLEVFLERIASREDCRYLAFGPPGVGKSVAFCRKLPYEWSCKRALKRFRLIIIIPLRKQHLAQTKDPAELLLSQVDYLRSDPKDRQRIYHEIEKQQAEVLIVLDGLDEVRTRNESAAFMSLLRRDILPLATVIATSRPCQLASRVSCWVDQCLEVVGFSDDDVKTFVYKILDDSDHDKAVSLLRIYDEEPSINDLMRVPLLALVLTFLYSEGKKIDSFVSGLYRTLYQNWLGYQGYRATVKNLHRSVDLSELKAELQCPPRGVSGFESVEDKHLQGLMFRLGKLAFDRLVADNEQLVFGANLIEEYTVEAAIDFGFLLHCEATSVESGQTKENVQFPHLTFQEFIACAYVASLKGKPQCDLIQECVHKLGHDENMKMFWLFLAGLSPRQAVDDIVQKLTENFLSLRLGKQADQRVEQSFLLLQLQVLHESFHGEINDEARREVGRLVEIALPSPGAISFQSRVKLRRNEVAALAFCLRLCPSVTQLNMANCDLDETSIKQLLPALEKVTHFTLDRNERLCGPAIRHLRQNASKLALEEISFYACMLKAADGKQLAALLRSVSSLRVLKLNWNDFGDEVAELLARVLRSGHQLRTLNMTRTELGGRGGKALLETACLPESKLSFVGLSQNPIDDSIGPALGKLLATGHVPRSIFLNKIRASGECLRTAAQTIHELGAHRQRQASEMSDKTSVDLIENFHQFSPEDLHALETALKEACSPAKVNFGDSVIENGRLKETDVRALFDTKLSGGSIDFRYALGCRGVQRLEQVLEDDPLLAMDVKDIRLRNNTLNDEAMNVIARLMKLVDLEALSVYDNCVTSHGLAAFCQSVETLDAPCLKNVNFGRNDLSGADGVGMKALANVLRNPSTSLVFLGLYWCNLTDEDVEPLMEALHTNKTVRFIDLGGNRLTGDTLRRLTSVVRSNTTLQFIQLGNNKIAEEVVIDVVGKLHVLHHLKRLWLGRNDPPLPEEVFGGSVVDGYNSYNEYPILE